MTESSQPTTTAGRRYRTRCDEIRRDIDVIEGRSRRTANVRLAVFLAGIVALGWAEAVRPPAVSFVLLVGTIAAAFVVLLVRHAAIRRRLRHLEAVWGVNDESARRAERDWEALAPQGEWAAGPDHPYADDLDVFGHASLFQLLGGVASVPGRKTLSAWLLAPAPALAVRDRQAAVRVLAPQRTFRDRLAVAARLAETSSADRLDSFLTWAESAPWLAARPALRWAARALAPLTVVLVALHLSGVTAVAWWIIPVLINAVITVRVRGRVHGVFGRAGAGDRAFRAYTEMLRVAHELEGGESAWIAQAQRRWGGHDELPHVEMGRLQRILAAADNRFSQLYPIIQGLVLWDLHVLDVLERWQSRCGKEARGWIDTLGELEALCGFARLADDHPDWTFPTMSDEAVVRARGLGHPLMHPDRVVTNDVKVGPQGTFLLVTGSNMSGKSTLLRAIGVNAVLGLAGAPVCARRLELPSVRLWTSMRVRDSLDQGVSYFMAGLRRLKAVVEAARDNGTARPPVLFLLDEILQGTNTAERLVAVRGVVAELVECGAIGAVTTHDLALAEAPELKPILEAVHFSESFEPGPNGGISFDYRLRPGVATSRNALRLMELMGLRHP